MSYVIQDKEMRGHSILVHSTVYVSVGACFCLSCSLPIRICLPVAGKMVSVHLYLRTVYLFGLGLVELI